MTTKKTVLIIVGVLAALALIVVLFVVAIGGFVFTAIGNSEAAEAARIYLRNNEVLKQDIGPVKDFSRFVTGNVNVANGDGEATLYLTVNGEKKSVKARVDLSYRSNRQWRVTGASYDRDGETVDLMKVYESPPN